MSTLLGLDLGASAMKLAVGDQSGVSQIASVLLPSDLIRDRKMVSEEAVAQEVKNALREQHMKKPLRRGHPGGERHRPPADRALYEPGTAAGESAL